MAITLSIPGIAYGQPVLWQELDDLAENDAAIKAALQVYRRPVLKFISVTQVDVENNTDTNNQTQIIFPDMSIRSVTEDTSSTNKYRRFDITATASFTSGTEDSGLRSGLSEAANTWYAIYAVKSQISSLNFVLVGDTTLPLQANYSTLNSRYGTDSWVYLGIIRNGDNASATTDILNFIQSGAYTRFKNTSGTIVGSKFGSGAVPQTYTLSNGTGTTDIPNNFYLVEWNVIFSQTINNSPIVSDSSGARVYFFQGGLSVNVTLTLMWRAPVNDGYKADATGGNATVNIAGWFDAALGVGINPII